MSIHIHSYSFIFIYITIAELNPFGTERKMLNIVKNLYSGTNGHVTVGEFMSGNFKISLGLQQGDLPTPFFFNIYMDELCAISNGKFQTAINELTEKAAKALGRVYRLSTCNFISTKTLLDTFTSLVKPIMLFSSEIWGYELKPDTNLTEKLFNKFCKHILGVHRNTTNLAIQAIQGELGTFPLLIDVKISMVSYYLYLRLLNSHLITDALSEDKKMHAQNNNRRSLISMVEHVIRENSINITSLLKTKLQSKFKEI